ncbi:MAG: RHS repeat protein, partial [Verrucomicrobia bacterium]|nr:RHS repeat protein [Verrucomicrobiota bacterium]
GWTAIPFELTLTNPSFLTSENISFEAPIHIISREGPDEWIYTVSTYHEGRIQYIREDSKQSLYKNEDGTYQLFLQGKASIFFDPKGILTHVVDLNGITTDYKIVDGKLKSIEHENGRSILLHYIEGRVMQASIPGKIRFCYLYDTKKQLETAYNPDIDLKMIYGYDSDFRLTSISSDKEILFEGSYDDYNRLTTIQTTKGLITQDYNMAKKSSTLITPSGAILESKYNQNYSLIGQQLFGEDVWKIDLKEGNQKTILFPNKESQDYTYTYNEKNLLEKATDLAGNSWKFTYDNFENIAIIEDPFQDKTVFIYDECNHLKQKIRHAKLLLTLSSSMKTEYKFDYDKEDMSCYEYNKLGRLEKIIEFGKTTILDYDANGLLKEITFPSGYVLKRKLDAQFQLESIFDSIGTLEKYLFDDLGRIIKKTTSYGTMTYTYKGELLESITDYCGHIIPFLKNKIINLIDEI